MHYDKYGNNVIGNDSPVGKTFVTVLEEHPEPRFPFGYVVKKKDTFYRPYIPGSIFGQFDEDVIITERRLKQRKPRCSNFDGYEVLQDEDLQYENNKKQNTAEASATEEKATTTSAVVKETLKAIETVVSPSATTTTTQTAVNNLTPWPSVNNVAAKISDHILKVDMSNPDSWIVAVVGLFVVICVIKIIKKLL